MSHARFGFAAALVFGFAGSACAQEAAEGWRPVGLTLPLAEDNDSKKLPEKNPEPKKAASEPAEAKNDAAAKRAEEPVPAAATKPAATAQAAANGLAALLQVAEQSNPKLAQGRFAIEAAAGRAVQAGLYPNPTLSITADELSDRQGPAGIWSAPVFSQEIVRGGKLQLAVAAACKEVDQATLQLLAQRFAILGDIRTAYFEVVALRGRLRVQDEVVELAAKSVEQTENLYKAKQVARLDVAQLQLELESLRADQEGLSRELAPAVRRLAAAVGVPDLAVEAAAGDLDALLPQYSLDGVQRYAAEYHPEVRAAATAVARARLLLDRARVQPIPNVTVQGGYVRQSQNRSNDWTFGVSIPLPVSDRNQGNIRAAQAAVGEAEQGVGNARLDLQDRIAARFRDYASAARRAEQYRDRLLPLAAETLELSAKSYKGGQFDSLRVLEAQRAVAQAKLKLVAAQGDAWKAAAALSAFALDEAWPRN